MTRSWGELLGDNANPDETDEERAGFFSRLRDSLGKTRRAMTEQLAAAAFDPADDESWERLEEALIAADVGVPTTAELVQRLEARQDVGELGATLAEEAAELLGDPGRLALDGPPSVILVVGVNGTGKTTTIGKLARRLVGEGRSVSLAGADTFRAAAGEQLEVWAVRADAHLVSQERGADPGAVVFDAVTSAKARGADVLIVDTAGRLHTKMPLMDELAKLRRVVEKAGATVHETLLVLDATTGQNGIAQARAFTDAVDVSGVVLTKLDGSARGGIVLAVREELGVPVRFVGTGEGADDLQPFRAATFAEGILAS